MTLGDLIDEIEESRRSESEGAVLGQSTVDSILVHLKNYAGLLKILERVSGEDLDERVPDTCIMLRAPGSRRHHKCDCGGNVFGATTKGNYICNSCSAIYQGDKVDQWR